jgi:hypothetical protein
MQATNKAERVKAFWNFLLLFIVCIGIIITTVFFSVQVPFRQNEQYREQMKALEKEREFSQQFMSQMLGITGMLDSINTKALKPDLLDGQITGDLRNLKIMTDADSSGSKVLYNAVIQTLYDLQASKKQLRDLTGKENNLSDMRMQLTECQTRLNIKESEVLSLRAMLQSR